LSHGILQIIQFEVVGRYIEVDPPHRVLIIWDRQGTDTATSTPTFIEIALTPTGDRTNVKVEFSDKSAGNPAFYRKLAARYLDRIVTALTNVESPT
jgi:uncharacterized protein YndB with AHSA1/START domain